MKNFQIQNFNKYQKSRETHYQRQSPKTKIEIEINSNLRTVFEEEPIIAYRRNKNLCDLIENKKILDGKVVCKNNSKKQLYCRPCFTRRNNIFCQQV